jgi:hypothetical protein
LRKALAARKCKCGGERARVCAQVRERPAFLLPPLNSPAFSTHLFAPQTAPAATCRPRCRARRAPRAPPARRRRCRVLQAPSRRRPAAQARAARARRARCART